MRHSPLCHPATDDGSAESYVTNNGSVVSDFAEYSDAQAYSLRGAGTVSNTRVNLLDWDKNVDRNNLTFTWSNTGSSDQTAHCISIYLRSGSNSPVVSSGWVKSTDSQLVTVSGLGAKLEDNQLYDRRVDVRYAIGC